MGAFDSRIFAISRTTHDTQTASFGVDPHDPTGRDPSRHAADASLPRSTPEAQGVSSQAILDFVEAADKINTLHSFMVVRHGHVIAEAWWKPEAADKPHVLMSLSKSFNSTAVGLAIEEGKLSLDDPVLKFFPADAPADPSDNLKAMKVRDLLTMTCGHDTEPKAGRRRAVGQAVPRPSRRRTSRAPISSTTRWAATPSRPSSPR